MTIVTLNNVVMGDLDSPSAYVYKVSNLLTGEYYIGSRYAKVVRTLRTPEEDFLIYYFTSSKKLAPLLKENPSQFKGEILFRSNAVILNPVTGFEEFVVFWREQELIKQCCKDPLCLNGYYIDPGSSNKCFMGNKISYKTVSDALNKFYAELPEEKRLLKNSKISATWKARNASQNKEAAAKRTKTNKKIILTCPHCLKSSTQSASFLGWHFDRCRMHPEFAIHRPYAALTDEEEKVLLAPFFNFLKEHGFMVVADIRKAIIDYLGMPYSLAKTYQLVHKHGFDVSKTSLLLQSEAAKQKGLSRITHKHNSKQQHHCEKCGETWTGIRGMGYHSKICVALKSLFVGSH